MTLSEETERDAVGAAASGGVDAEERAWRLALWCAEGIGAVRYGRLLERFGSAAEALAAGPRACAEGLRRPALESQLKLRWGARLRDELEESLRRGELLALGRGEAGYPRLLAEADGPPWLFARGSLEALAAPLLAVVGTRRIRTDGARLTRRVTGWCGERGWGIASGGALGVDGEAHRAALELGLPTAVVLPAGMAHPTPPAHAGLFESVCASGGILLSENPPWRPPRRELFLRRNRLISGLAVLTIIVRAPRQSGALNTAGWARRQGREVFVVPGAPDDPTASGCLALLREGARLLTSAEDLPLAPAEAAGRARSSEPAARPRELEAAAPLEPTAARVLEGLRGGERTTEALAAELDLSASAVLVAVTRLVLAGQLEQVGPGVVRARS
jgi:DNA processing protein